MFLSFHAFSLRHPTATVTAWENQMRTSIPSDCPCPWQCSLISSYIIWYLIISDHIWSFWGWNIWNHQKSLITVHLQYVVYVYIYCICDFRPSKTFVHKSTWSPTSPLRSKVELKWRALAVFAASPLFVCAQIQGNPLLGWDGQRSKPGCEMIWTNWAWKLYRYLSYLYVVIWLICGYPWISDISVRL